jgi:hypothetical protein
MHGIQMNITGEGEKIIGFFDDITFEAPLEEVAMSLVASIKKDCIGRQETAHEFGKGRSVGAFQQEVKMGGHKAPGVNLVGKNIGIFINIGKKFLFIPCIIKSQVTSICSGKNMVKRKRQIYSFWSSHVLILAKDGVKCQAVSGFKGKSDPFAPPLAPINIWDYG